jgi:hypothetical protein
MKGELDTVDGRLVVKWATYNAFQPPTEGTLQVMTHGALEREDFRVGSIAPMPAARRAMDLGGADDPDDDRPLWGMLTAPRSVEIPEDEEFLWHHLKDVFTVVEAERNPDSNTYSSRSDFRRWKLTGEATLEGEGRQRTVSIDWGTLASARKPLLIKGAGMWRDYNGASLTAHAFDRQFPGLGKILVPVAAWLFAISTMISWSYYGEQGMIYMLGQRSVLPYKLLYLVCILFAANWITDTRDMENLMDLGSGAMLWSNIPIVLCLGFLAVRALDTYRKKLRAGEFPRRGRPSVEDVISGRDVE